MNDPRSNPDDVAAFLRGDRDQIASIEEVVRGVVRSFQFRNSDLDRDLIQDALSRILLSLAGGRFRGEASLKTFARKVARYTCLEQIRRRRWGAETDPESLPSGALWSAPERSFLWEEEHLRNLNAFASLPADCRELLRLVCLEGVSYREIARRLGVTEAAVKSRIHRCRQACREAAGLPHKPVRRGPRRSRP